MTHEANSHNKEGGSQQPASAQGSAMGMTTDTHVPGKSRVLTGIQPTGTLHLGNYFGAIRPCIEFSKNPSYEVILLCVDWHGMTNRAQILTPGKTTLSVIAAFIALGFNFQNNSLILQSDFPQIQENAWYLACSTAVGMLERAHAYKDAQANGKDATGGLLFYPVLMTSDIVTFDAQIVPVGKDQSQHLEYASDMAGYFNNTVGKPVFLPPKALIQETPVLPGLDGRKMSKSYNNAIPLFAPKKELEKKIKEIKTDSAGLDDPKDPESCLIFQILKSFGSQEAVAYMRERMEKGTGYGYGHAKKDLLDEHERVFGTLRETYEHYLNHPGEVQRMMEPGVEQATRYADAVRARARHAMGLCSFRARN